MRNWWQSRFIWIGVALLGLFCSLQSNLIQRIVAGASSEKARNVVTETKSKPAQQIGRNTKKRELIDSLWKEVLEKHPHLRLEKETLRPEEDAFAGYDALCRSMMEDEWESVRAKFKELEEGEFDLVKAESLLLESQGLLESFEELVRRTGATWDSVETGFIDVNPSLVLQDLSLLKTKVLLLHGESEEARRSFEVSRLWEEKLSGTESSTLLSESVRILSHLSASRNLRKEIVPLLSAHEFEDWSSLAKPADFSPTRLANVLRGEGTVTITQLLPAISGEISEEALVEFVPFYGDFLAERVRRIESEGHHYFLTEEEEFEPSFNFSHSEAEELFSGISAQINVWKHNYLRAWVSSHQQAAAFEVLQREVGGEVYEGVVNIEVDNPILEEGFLFDSTIREMVVGPEFLSLIEPEQKWMFSAISIPSLSP